MGPPAKPSESGFVGERTSVEMRELSAKQEAKDMKTVRTIWMF